MPDSPDLSLLADLVVMFVGVFSAQLASNHCEDKRSRRVQREQAENLREQMSNDLQFALVATVGARKILDERGTAPEMHVPLGTLASHLYEVREICMGNMERVSEFMIASEEIKLFNKRLGIIEERAFRDLDVGHESQEHKAQVKDGIKKAAALRLRLEGLLSFVDPEAANDWLQRNAQK